MEIIQYVDPTGQTMVARVPSQGTKAIQLGSQLVVEESQQAVFFRDGKALDTFTSGRHTLTTLNLPLLGSIPSNPNSASRRAYRTAVSGASPWVGV